MKHLASPLSLLVLLGLPLVGCLSDDEQRDLSSGHAALDGVFDPGNDPPPPPASQCAERRLLDTAPNRVASFGWRGMLSTATSLDFAASNFTVSFWYMAQYPRGYEGPIVTSDASDDNFMIGQGLFKDSDGDGTREKQLEVRFANAKASYRVPVDGAVGPGTWTHIALRRSSSKLQLFVNGAHVCRTGSTCDLPVPAAAPPTGNLRFGRAYDTALEQFYGLLDDVAVIQRAVTDAEITTLACNARLRADTVPGIAKAWSFDTTNPDGRTLSSVLATPFRPWIVASLTPVSIVQTPSPARQPSDQVKLLAPVHLGTYNLPFAKGTIWYVEQSPGDLLSHHGSAVFSYDFVRYDDDLDWVSSDGQPIYASASATFTLVEETKTGTNEMDNVGYIQANPWEQVGYVHLKTGWYSDLFSTPFATVAAGAKVATVGPWWIKATGGGADTDNSHLHTSLRGGPNAGNSGTRTIPLAYSNFYRRNASGGWDYVARGALHTGDIVKW